MRNNWGMNDPQISLSYVMTTFNKLDFLKVTLTHAIAACMPDEEIVVVDGGSADGSGEYLRGLQVDGKIHQFVSEKDAGESHGLNKAILLARGKLIKVITDDDIFHYPAIQACKSFLLANPQVDVLAFDGYGVNRSEKQLAFRATDFKKGFLEWRENRRPFLFSGLSLMFRRQSIPQLGLFNTLVKIVDMEYSMRVTSMKIGIAYYTGLAFVNIVGPESNSVRFSRVLENERKQARQMYLPHEPAVTLRQSARNARAWLGAFRRQILGQEQDTIPHPFAAVAEAARKRLEEDFGKQPAEILYSRP